MPKHLKYTKDGYVAVVQIIEEFQKCHTDHPLGKFLGQCTELKVKLDRCFRQEVRFLTLAIQKLCLWKHVFGVPHVWAIKRIWCPSAESYKEESKFWTEQEVEREAPGLQERNCWNAILNLIIVMLTRHCCAIFQHAKESLIAGIYQRKIGE